MMLTAKQIENMIKKTSITVEEAKQIVASECPDQLESPDMMFIAQCIVDEWTANANVYDQFGEDAPHGNDCDIF